MSRGYIVGMGGQPLAFDIVGSLTQPPRRENRIWVDTDTAVTGWLFSHSAPASPAEGMLWFKTELRSPVGFNALHRNGIYICPDRCSQYISGAWVRKRAMSCLSGQWREWKRYLIAQGNIREAWTLSGAVSEAGTGFISYKPSQGVGGSGTVTLTLDVTDYSTVTLDGFNSGSPGCTALRLTVGGSTLDLKALSGRQEVSLDITALTGQQTVTITLMNESDSIGVVEWAILEVYDLYLS